MERLGLDVAIADTLVPEADAGQLVQCVPT